MMRGFPGSSVVKNLPAMEEIWVQSLGQEDPLEEEMVTHSSILTWEIPRTTGSQRVRHDLATKHTHAHTTAPRLGRQNLSPSERRGLMAQVAPRNMSAIPEKVKRTKYSSWARIVKDR